MTANKSPEYKFWNGKNVEGGSNVGNKNLISEGPKDKTGSKYEVSNDTKVITSKDLEFSCELSPCDCECKSDSKCK